MLFLTAKEPQRTGDDGEIVKCISQEKNKNLQPNKLSKDEKNFGESGSGWNAVKNPALIILIIGACVRHAGGYCWGYNSALYFKTYYPDYDVSIWLTVISIGAGLSGCFLGGWLSDCLVNKMGIQARALVLGMSQVSYHYDIKYICMYEINL